MMTFYTVPQTLIRTQTPWNDVSIVQRGERIDMEVSGAVFATYHPGRFLSGYSWDALTAATLLKPGSAPRSVLLLGLAGGTVARQVRQLLPNARLVAVEIDSALVELAERYMDLKRQNVEVFLQDASLFLRNCKDKFEVIIDDLYLCAADDVKRPSVPAGRYLKLLKSHLQPDGILVANFINDVGHEGPLALAQRAFAKNFSATAQVLPPLGLNEILVGGDKLGNRDVLDAYRPAFPAEEDQDRWDEIRVNGSIPIS